MNSLLFPIRKIGFTVRSTISQDPKYASLYTPFIVWGQFKGKLRGKEDSESTVTTSTELVIDGFQGSANSFATVAFRYFQDKPVQLAHHLHAPVLIISAVEKAIPVLLTVREPEGTVMSLTSRWPYVSVVQALRSYIGFYGCLLPYASECIISDFSTTTKGLDRIIAALNVKYSTNFALVNVDVANRVCRAAVSDSPDSYARRKQLKAKKKTELYSSALALKLLDDANVLYSKYQSMHEQCLKEG
ncbi:hypothetical protein [Halomicronema sp. CCY15110]|uniref:hypothetical protein n=1 Tax=Halomicronema sp. CCY15110 TaxID=2767773 RepID=UPI00195085D4|nr:hypothetical protein [Halomicronema sp. CCY15110]